MSMIKCGINHDIKPNMIKIIVVIDHASYAMWVKNANFLHRPQSSPSLFIGAFVISFPGVDDPHDAVIPTLIQ